ncbi:hypothetical protein [Streptomyces xinghaiensis]|uniref:hypothetical protein n=1 Tax=Streptomyces xinghaiensis TaxID=1038928 RepID=UPI002E0FB473|nr:hypothetical protein OG463_16090 [Streptomyces xinghaiensis]
MSDEAGVARLLPWSNEGKSCYLLGGGSGYVSRLADDMERVQLGMAGELLGHAADLLGDPRATPPQLRFLAARLAESLRDVHRIAESRGARLPVREGDGKGLNEPPGMGS